MERKIDHYIHTGGHSQRWYKNEYKPDLSHCRFSVAEHGRITDWHQCNRKAVETIEGFGFCKVHASEVKRGLGIQEASGTKFAAGFSSDRTPCLIELSIAGETDSTIDIISAKTIIGNAFGLYSGKSKKNSSYTRAYTFFDNKNDALKWLISTSFDHIRSSEESLEKAREVNRFLLDLS